MQIFKGIKLLGKQQHQFLKFQYKQSHYFSKLSHTEELKALAEILGMKNQKVNEDIEKAGAQDVRLVNEHSKQIGVFTFDQALKQAQDKGLDLVLVSDSVSPMICKISNYKETLYKKFIDEVIKKDSSLKKKKTKKSEKKIQIANKISMGDLQNKAQQTIDLAKKFEKFNIFIYCNDKTVENAKNLLYTFSDLIRNDLSMEDNELKDIKIDVDYIDPAELEEEEDTPTRKVEMTFLSNSYSQASQDFTEEQIKSLITQFFNKSKSRFENKDLAEEIKKERVFDVNQENQQKVQQGDTLEIDSEMHFDEEIMEKYLKQQNTNENDDRYSDDIMQSMEGFAQNHNINVAELQAEVEELKLKYDTNATTAILKDTFSKQKQKVDEIQRLRKLLYSKN